MCQRALSSYLTVFGWIAFSTRGFAREQLRLPADGNRKFTKERE